MLFHSASYLLLLLQTRPTGFTSSAYGSGEYGEDLGSESSPNFQFLDKNYSLKTPSCLIPQVNELFKSICERYDIAVTNREKVDEALHLFKRVLEVDPSLPMVDCFNVWKSQLTNPKFTVSRNEVSADVKKISVRADDIPRQKRKAQKHIKDLLDACHLFLQQRDFLKKQITSNLEELDRITRDIPSLCKGLNLSSSERKHMPQVIKQARDQFVQFPGRIDRFWNQVFSLIHDINGAVYVLQGGQ